MRVPTIFAVLALANVGAMAQSPEIKLDDDFDVMHQPSRMQLGSAEEYTAGMALVDFDSDGDLDLFVANGRHWPGQNEVWFNNGAGKLLEVAHVGTRKATAYGVCPGDFDGDGDVDVIVARDHLKPVVFLNDGDGAFPIKTPFGRIGPARDCSAGDFDNDGGLDVALTARGASAYVVFSPLSSTRSEIVDVATGFIVGVSNADFDGDGNLDLLFANRGGHTLTLVRNSGARTFEHSMPISQLKLQSRSAQPADMDGDGDVDIVVAVVDGANVVMLNDNGDFKRAIEIGPDSEESYSILPRDFNGDGRLDLLVGNIGDDAIILNRPSGYKRIKLTGSDGDTYALATGDVNGDGIPDFVLGNSLAPNKVYFTRRRQQ